MNEARLAFLNDTVKFYSEDPSRVSKKNNECLYKAPDGRQCAIGRHLLFYDPRMENKDVVILIEDFPGCLPQNILDLGDGFLITMQSFHDRADWSDEESVNDWITKIKQEFIE